MICVYNGQILLKLQSDFVDNNTYEFDRNIIIFYTIIGLSIVASAVGLL